MELSSNQLNAALSSNASPASPASSKSKGVWVYDQKTMKLITYEVNVKLCLAKYNISSTHFKRIRKFSMPFNGMLFSNTKI